MTFLIILFYLLKEICKYLIQSAGDGSSLTPETAHQIITTWKALKICQALPVGPIVKVLL